MFEKSSKVFFFNMSTSLETEFAVFAHIVGNIKRRGIFNVTKWNMECSVVQNGRIIFKQL
jgi:hypothetical protein